MPRQPELSGGVHLGGAKQGRSELSRGQTKREEPSRVVKAGGA